MTEITATYQLSNLTRRQLPASLRKLLVGSLGVHTGVVLLAIAAQALGGGLRAREPIEFMPTKLVRLGEKRPEQMLPRLESPAPASTPTPDAPPSPPTASSPPVTLGKPTPAPSVRTTQQALSNLREQTQVTGALNRLRGLVAGDPEGVREGEVSDAQLAIAGNKFATEVFRCLKQHYAIEGIDRTAVADKVATVRIQIGPTGFFTKSQISQGSGLPAFDRAVERAVERCGKVSPPPEVLRARVARDGLEIVFKP